MNTYSVAITKIGSKVYNQAVDFIKKGYSEKIPEDALFVIKELERYVREIRDSCADCLIAYHGKNFYGMVCVFRDNKTLYNDIIIQSIIKNPEYLGKSYRSLNNIFIPFIEKVYKPTYIFVNPYERQGDILYKYYGFRHSLDNEEVMKRYPSTQEEMPPTVTACGQNFTIDMYYKV